MTSGCKLAPCVTGCLRVSPNGIRLPWSRSPTTISSGWRPSPLESGASRRIALRVALAPKLAVLQALLQSFAAGERIASTDPAVLQLHATATAHRSQLAPAAGQGPAAKTSGTLRAVG